MNQDFRTMCRQTLMHTFEAETVFMVLAINGYAKLHIDNLLNAYQSYYTARYFKAVRASASLLSKLNCRCRILLLIRPDTVE